MIHPTGIEHQHQEEQVQSIELWPLSSRPEEEDPNDSSSMVIKMDGDNGIGRLEDSGEILQQQQQQQPEMQHNGEMEEV